MLRRSVIECDKNYLEIGSKRNIRFTTRVKDLYQSLFSLEARSRWKFLELEINLKENIHDILFKLFETRTYKC